ncbi:replication-relaxation family protein [Neobacillus drentensis]|uniref:replication-relaxation family protein n=1 Tax=Neobacillus drentensis TaxID=220684 RepID=UPI003002E1CB
MKPRDLEILKSLEKFKCLTRDQIAAIHFNKNARPHISANQVLKRLRRDNYITANTDRSFQQYIYFNNPSPIKLDSQKLDHYLLMNQTIIDMMQYSPITEFHFETSIPDADFIPDINVKGWLDNDWFIECQNSLYTTKQLYSKLDRYKSYFDKGYWNNEKVLIIGKVNLKFDTDDYPFKVKQVRGIEDLSDVIKRFKEVKLQEFKEKVRGGNNSTVSNNNEVSRVVKSGGKKINFVPKSG